MTDKIDKENSQKLIRCTVEGGGQSKGVRHIELDYYKFWSYVMIHRHGLKIKDASLWLWVHQSDYLKNEGVYAHFQDVEEVNRIGISLHDELYGFTHTTYRYVLGAETAILEQVLLSHLAPELIKSGNYAMNTVRGVCIKCGKGLKRMVLGLSGLDDRIWYRKE